MLQKNRCGPCVRIVTVAILSVSSAGLAFADITIVPPRGTAYDLTDPLGNLPPGASGNVTLNPANVTHLAPPAMGSTIFTRFAAEAPAQFPGWTAVAGAALNGTLTINEYDARDYVAEPRVGFDTPRGGADMRATFARAAADPAIANLRFINLFTDNTGAGGALVSHIDPFPNDDPAGARLPWYYTELEHAAHSTAANMTFEDSPSSRVVSIPFHRTVSFETYLATFDAARQTAMIRDGWSWGYTVTAVPEPSPALLFAVGLSTLFFLSRRRFMWAN
ncbi:PEP-CTERM sorting domain-containing protein [Nitrosospira sp. NpAV]|uniref:PEP-CTERM sorting domain-containing protein n=1 Tax=Nitrosospira sp. NpAV TaxID=58133 RepID=UPI00059F6948|nr:PEP-CTERM sorting domain-containing protein [Nitrosospira sp. NpAV]KIO50085.1 hypothetical protein SQ11_04160 [Nitrosospira sp. NpAV]